MLSRPGWIGCALATGLLLQIGVQIRWLRWLPDFPIYLALALVAGGAAVAAGAFLSAAAARKRSTGRPPLWLQIAAIGGFALLAIFHAALAARASSSAVEWWRNALL